METIQKELPEDQERMHRIQVSMYTNLINQIDRERGSISRSSYIRAILESAKLSGNTLHKLARKEQDKADSKKYRGGSRPAK